MTPTRDCYVLVYVDDLLFLGQQQTVDKLFTAIQQQLLLRPTGTLNPGSTVSFMGRNIHNRGDQYEISLSSDCADKLLEETNMTNMTNCNPAVAPGTSTLKQAAATADHEQPLHEEEHKAYRQAVGQLQWKTYTRPDTCYATYELARSLQAPTTTDQQKLKYLLRYIKGTKRYKQVKRPTAKIPASATPEINVYVDSDWAGCTTTRRSTTGFIITILGTIVSYGSRTQETVALPPARKPSSTPSTQVQQKHSTCATSLWNYSASNTSTSRFTQIPAVAKAWQHALALQEKPNTLNSNTFLSSNWSWTTLFGS